MAARKGPRDLRPDERALWRAVEQTARPLHPAQAARKPEARPTAAAPPREPADLGRLRTGAPEPAGPRARGAVEIPLAMPQPPRMDAKAFARMRRGKLPVEGRIDLHGMTLDEAHPRLVSFVLDAQAAGKRLVLVITGKGRPSTAAGPMPAHRGVLRRQVPLWLNSGALAGRVLEIREAHRSHGGAGAYYVYLRRRPQ